MTSSRNLADLTAAVLPEIVKRAESLAAMTPNLPEPLFTVGVQKTLGILWARGSRRASINLQTNEMLLCLSGDNEGMHMIQVDPQRMGIYIDRIASWLG